MQNEINRYLDLIKQDYINTTYSKEMIEDFVNNVTCHEGSKYIKVVARNSVHSFIVKNDHGKFKKGDILKAASWNAPAKNCARGNIFNEVIHTSWTGPYYLK